MGSNIETSDTERNHHEITITYKCPMPGCGNKNEVSWSSLEFPRLLRGISVGDTVEGRGFHCPECEKNGVPHSDLFEVTDVKGDPVNTDYDPLEGSE